MRIRAEQTLSSRRLDEIRMGLGLIVRAMLEAWVGFQLRDADCLSVAGSCALAALALCFPRVKFAW